MSARPRRRERDGRRARRCAMRSQRAPATTSVTVVAPINQPPRGYVVYADTRRASARRRLDRALGASPRGGRLRRRLRRRGRSAAARARRARDSSSRRSTRSSSRPTPRRSPAGCGAASSTRSARPPGSFPSSTSSPKGEAPDEANVLVDRERDGARRAAAGEDPRARRGEPRGFLIISPQSDPTPRAHPEAEARLKRAVAELRHEGIDVHGQVAHPDPFSAAMEAVHDERIDEIIVSTSSPSAPAGSAATSSSGCARRRACRSSTSSSRRKRGGAGMSAAAHAAHVTTHEHHGPPVPHYSSRIKPEDARDVPLHRVGDHALRLVLHGVLLRPHRQRRRRGRRRRTTCRSSSRRSTRRSS